MSWQCASFEFDTDKPVIMGILTVTPDSFSDGGQFASAEEAVARGRQMAEEGAAIIDVGGESTRPGAAPVDAEEEWRRVGPVIEALAAEGLCVSADTRRGGGGIRHQRRVRLPRSGHARRGRRLRRGPGGHAHAGRAGHHAG